jgi:hypothetical protein
VIGHGPVHGPATVRSGPVHGHGPVRDGSDSPVHFNTLRNTIGKHNIFIILSNKVIKTL